MFATLGQKWIDSQEKGGGEPKIVIVHKEGTRSFDSTYETTNIFFVSNKAEITHVFLHSERTHAQKL